MIYSWLAVSTILSVVVSPLRFGGATSESQLWRVFYLTPFGITAPLGVITVSDFLRSKFHTESNERATTYAENERVLCIWFGLIAANGVLLSVAPAVLRAAIFLALLPGSIGLILVSQPTREEEILARTFTLFFVLVAFNSAIRSLSQLLLDPHNCSVC
jgi:hypothetical protein